MSLVFVPVGRGTPLQLEINYSRDPVKPLRGQTLRSPRPKANSDNGPDDCFCRALDRSCIHVCVYLSLSLYTHIYIISLSLSLYIYIYIYIYTYNIYIYIYIYTHIHTSTYTYITSSPLKGSSLSPRSTLGWAARRHVVAITCARSQLGELWNACR